MLKFFSVFLVLFSLLGCDIHVPVSKNDIENMKENLEKCISNLDMAQLYLHTAANHQIVSLNKAVPYQILIWHSFI